MRFPCGIIEKFLSTSISVGFIAKKNETTDIPATTIPAARYPPASLDASFASFVKLSNLNAVARSS